MRKHILTALLVMLTFVTFGQQWVAIKSDNPSTIQTTLVSSSESQITVNLQVPGFYAFEVTTPRGEANIISVPRTVSTAAAGEPNLPMIAVPAIVGDRQHYNIRVVDAQYSDFQMEVAPSKGDFPRTINPDDVPYTYGEAYSTDAFFPAQNVGLYEPYILRDFRGQNMVVYPFAYNPVTHTLRVYYNMTVEMYADGQQGENTLSRRSNTVKMDAEFGAMYQNHFVNYHESLNRYTPVDETGELLIICHDAFMSAMQPFVNWKKQIGRPTTMVGTSTTGTTDSAIKTYIQNQYNANNNLSHVLLVGDVQQVPGHTQSGGGYSGKSDNWYGQIVGNDTYNDLIIGRFSAENEAQVTTQVNRVIHYERDINTSDTWLSTGQGISKNEGAGSGHYGESDYQHIDNIRDDLLDYTYTTVHRDYQGVSGVNSSAAIISQHINEGVSIINYCNHGSTTSWGVFGYSNSHVNALTNDNMLPFIWSVACDNGKYDYSGTCFAETWLRATNNSTGAPTGAIGGMFSYISQPWQPPQYGQDEMVDVLVESNSSNIKRTLGGTSYDGNMKILDQYGQNPGQGWATYFFWILFGDPSLTVRTAVPTNMNVTHASTMSSTATSFTVNASNGNGALATLTRNNEILGSATINNGTANITFTAPGTTGTATLTVFGYNKVTYIGTVNITSGGTQYTVDVSANPTNGGTVTGGGTYNQGQSCTVSATPNSGFTFTNWTENGNVVSTQANYTFTVNNNRTLVANFTAQPQNHTITVSANPNNGGTATGGGTYQHGESCTVTATANTGFVFVNWTENGNVVSTRINYNFIVTSDRNLVANFTAVQNYTITVSANPSNGGSATGGGTYQQGQQCTVIATPATGYAFTNWTENGNVVSTNANYTFTVSGNRTLVANFTPQEFTITVSANPNNGGTVTGGGTYTYGQTCTLGATANAGYIFMDWTKDGQQVSSTTPYTFTVTESASYVANFQEFTCEAPTNVIAEAISYTDIYVTWDAVSSAYAFDIYRNGTLIASGYPYVGDYYDTELPYGEYCYTIVAKCGPSDSDPSEEACATLNIPCNEPANFTAEYVYEDETDFGVKLQWNSVAPIYPDYFHLYKQRNTAEYELVADLQPEGTSYTYFDMTEIGTYSYKLTAEYHFDGQICVSDPVYASCEVTKVEETLGTFNLFPNPTKGEVTLEGEGLSHIRIVNAYGQTVYNADLEGNKAHIDLSDMGKGIYMMHIEANGGQTVRKIVVE